MVVELVKRDPIFEIGSLELPNAYCFTSSTSTLDLFSVVPVGTLITERPPDGSVRARLRIRLL
jgi:hypothetical protein